MWHVHIAAAELVGHTVLIDLYWRINGANAAFLNVSCVLVQAQQPIFVCEAG